MSIKAVINATFFNVNKFILKMLSKLIRIRFSYIYIYKCQFYNKIVKNNIYFETLENFGSNTFTVVN